MKTAKMSGEGQFGEQAKKQWEKLDAEGRKIINDLLVADKDRTVWPENTEPKCTGKKREKMIKVPFHTKSKKYMHIYEEKDELPAEEQSGQIFQMLTSTSVSIQQKTSTS